MANEALKGQFVDGFKDYPDHNCEGYFGPPLLCQKTFCVHLAVKGINNSKGQETNMSYYYAVGSRNQAAMGDFLSNSASGVRCAFSDRYYAFPDRAAPYDIHIAALLEGYAMCKLNSSDLFLLSPTLES